MREWEKAVTAAELRCLLEVCGGAITDAKAEDAELALTLARQRISRSKGEHR